MLKRTAAIVMVVIMAAFVAGCSGKKLAPKDVADKFWNASKEGELDKVKPFVTEASYKSMKAEEGKGGVGAVKKEGDFKLGEAKIEGDKATIPTSLTEEGYSFDLQTIVVKEGGKWKVDVTQTMMSMMGGAMGEMMKGMGEAMGEAMEGMGEAMGEAAKGMEKAVEGMEEALKEPPVKEEAAAPEIAEPAGKSFKKGDRVLVFWNNTWYPAQVVDVGDNKWYIKYDGYHSGWNEWVGPDRIEVAQE